MSEHQLRGHFCSFSSAGNRSCGACGSCTVRSSPTPNRCKTAFLYGTSKEDLQLYMEVKTAPCMVCKLLNSLCRWIPSMLQLDYNRQLGRLKLSQEVGACKILKKFGMEKGLQLAQTGNRTQEPYRELLGSLR